MITDGTNFTHLVVLLHAILKFIWIIEQIYASVLPAKYMNRTQPHDFGAKGSRGGQEDMFNPNLTHKLIA